MLYIHNQLGWVSYNLRCTKEKEYMSKGSIGGRQWQFPTINGRRNKIQNSQTST